MTCSFCVGERRARTVAFSAVSTSCSGVRPTSWGPVTRCSTSMPTSLQTLRVTRSLSPVRIFTATPASFSAFRDCAVDSLGGSRKAI